jgi:hypothetical protein
VLFLAHVPCGVLSGGEDFGDLFDFLGYLPQRIVGGVCWSEPLHESLYAVVFLSVRSCLSSCVAVLSSLLLYGVWNLCQTLWGLCFSSIFCCTSIWIGQFKVVSISVCSGVAFQTAHCIVSLKT